MRKMTTKKPLKRGSNMSVSARIMEAVDVYIRERGFGSRTQIAEAALAEFLQRKGYNIEPTPEQFSKALNAPQEPEKKVRKRSK